MAERTRRPLFCSVDGCERKRFNEGMCTRHVAEAREARGDLCAEPGCNRPRFGKTHCPKHATIASRAIHGRATDHRHEITCAWCGREAKVTKAAGRHCSATCAKRHQASLLPPKPPKPPKVVRYPKRSPSHKIFPKLCSVCERCFVTRHAGLPTCSPDCAEVKRLDMKKRGRDRRRARKSGAYVADVWRRDIFERDHWKCKLCGKALKRKAKAPHPLAPTIDHIIPLAAGGTHEPANAQAAHFICNCLKRDGGTDQLLLFG